MAPRRIFRPPPGFDYRTSTTDPSGIQWLRDHSQTILVAICGRVGEQVEREPKAAYGIFFGQGSRHNEQGLLLREIIQQPCINDDGPNLYAALRAVRAAREYALGTTIKMVVLRTASPWLGEYMDEEVWYLEQNGYRNSRGEQVPNMALSRNLHEALLSLERMGTDVKFWAVHPQITDIVATQKLCMSALKGTPDVEQMARHFPDQSSLILGTVPDPPSSQKPSTTSRLLEHSMILETFSNPPSSPESPPPSERLDQMVLDSPDRPSFIGTFPNPASASKSPSSSGLLQRKLSNIRRDRIFNPASYFHSIGQETEAIATDSSGLRRLPNDEQPVLVDIYGCQKGPKSACGVFFGEKSPFNQFVLSPESFPLLDQAIELYSAIVALRAVKQIALETEVTSVVLKTASSTNFLQQHMGTGIIWKWERDGYVNMHGKPVRHAELFQDLHGLFLALEDKGTEVKIWKVPRKSNVAAEQLARSAFATR